MLFVRIAKTVTHNEYVDTLKHDTVNCITIYLTLATINPLRVSWSVYRHIFVFRRVSSSLIWVWTNWVSRVNVWYPPDEYGFFILNFTETNNLQWMHVIDRLIFNPPYLVYIGNENNIAVIVSIDKSHCCWRCFKLEKYIFRDFRHILPRKCYISLSHERLFFV